MPLRTPFRIALPLLTALLAWTAAAEALPVGRPAAPGLAELSDWALYKRRFLTTDGRIVDTGNGRISHSESQGIGMLLAEAFADRDAFERIWRWTESHLRWRNGSLHAWKWAPGSEEPLPDRNNATDGDLLIGWALERSARRWGEPGHADAARRIAQDIRRLLVTSAAGRVVLLPGFDGFDGSGGLTINLSYYVFPAIDALARLDPAPEWDRLRRDALDLLEDARFGRWGLPPDWLRLEADGRLMPAADRPARFGYDAVRIPLYLVWSGLGTPARLAGYETFWRQFRDAGRPPGWASLPDNGLAPYAAAAGLAAVARLVEAGASAATERPAFPELGKADDYYSASLLLLSRLAAREALPSPRR